MRNQKFAESQVSPPPLGGAGAQWAPFSACPSRQARVSCLWHDGEGNPPPARTCADLLMSTSASELPKARLENPGTGLHSGGEHGTISPATRLHARKADHLL